MLQPMTWCCLAAKAKGRVLPRRGFAPDKDSKFSCSYGSEQPRPHVSQCNSAAKPRAAKTWILEGIFTEARRLGGGVLGGFGLES